MSPRKSHRQFRPPMVGGSSLLVIFAVLCLTIFTLLTLSTVQANARLSEASIRSVTDYYEADHQAELIFAELRSGHVPDQVQCTDVLETTYPGQPLSAGWIYSYSCPISDTQDLLVQLHLDQGVWTILRWQAVSTVTYQ